MREITYAEAVREALEEEMKRDDRVFVLGEDVGLMGGCFGVTGDLYKKFPDRVLDTPIAETAILGLSIGAAYSGLKPVAEIMFADFVGVIYDYLINQITSNRYMTGMQPNGGQDGCMVLRAPNGTGIRAGAQHSQSIQNYLMPIVGIKIAIPSTPYDAKGMLKYCLRENNDPVVFLEHKMLYGVKGEVPEEDYVVPLGVAEVKKEGTDVTVIATSLQVTYALEAAKELEGEISVEVVDPRSLKPLDIKTLVESVKKTGRLVFFDECPSTGNAFVEVARRIQEEAFDALSKPPVYVCAPDTPIPFAPNLEDAWTPNKDDVIEGIKKAMA